jgi:trehalose/maltose hydrolase-like predicted phosphorylase
MAGTVCDVVFTFGGVNLKGSFPVINPALPDHWTSLEFGFYFRDTHYQLAVSPGALKIFAENAGKEKIIVHLCGVKTELPREEWFTIKC